MIHFKITKKRVIVIICMVPILSIWIGMVVNINSKLTNPVEAVYQANQSFELYGLDVNEKEYELLTPKQVLDSDLDLSSDLISTSMNYLCVTFQVSNPTNEVICLDTVAWGVEIDSYGNGMDLYVTQAYNANFYAFEANSAKEVTLVFTIPREYGMDVIKEKDVKIVMSLYPYFKYILL